MNEEGAETVATHVCVFVRTAEDAMTERRSGVCEANALEPLLQGRGESPGVETR